MVGKLLVLGGFVLSSTLFVLNARPTVLDVSALDETVLERGHQFMLLKGFVDRDDPVKVRDWNFPTSIVVKGISYSIKGGRLFRICTTIQPHGVFAEGFVIKAESTGTARKVAFGDMSLNNQPLVSSALETMVSILGDKTNLVYMTNGEQDKDAKSVLQYKNISIVIRESTNKLDFAAAILNAGLPENERFTLPRQGTTR